MHDLVIRGGTVVDGTGSKPRRADVAIDGDRLVMAGPGYYGVGTVGGPVDFRKTDQLVKGCVCWRGPVAACDGVAVIACGKCLVVLPAEGAPTPIPARDMDPAAVAFHAKAVKALRGILYRGAEQVTGHIG